MTGRTFNWGRLVWQGSLENCDPEVKKRDIKETEAKKVRTKARKTVRRNKKINIPRMH